MIDKDPPDNPFGQLLEDVLGDGPEQDTVVTLLAPASGQGFAYAIEDGGVALVLVSDDASRTETMTAEQARILGNQLINAAGVDDENW